VVGWTGNGGDWICTGWKGLVSGGERDFADALVLRTSGRTATIF
jgi:hypothetical protein